MKLRNFNILVVLMIMTCAAKDSLGVRLKGYREIDNIVKARLLVADSKFEMTKDGTKGTNLYSLLGSFIDAREFGPFPYFFDPQPLNMALWNQVIRQFSVTVATTCNNRHLEPNPLSKLFKKDFLDLVLLACDFPASQKVSAEYLDELWEYLIFYDAPLEEREAWKSFLISKYSNQAGKEFLKSAIHAAFLNPYFLMTP